jgi:hypothetical protein
MAKNRKPPNDFLGDDESVFINENDIPKMTREQWEAQQQAEPDPVEDDRLTELKDKADTVTIEYESEGRFSIPAKFNWHNWIYKQLHNLTLSNQEDRLEAIVVALEELKAGDDDFEIQNMAGEELFETLIAIKQKFQGPSHTHKWMCSCQDELDDDSKLASEQVVDLRTLKYISATEAETNLREFMKTRLEKLSPDQLKLYFKHQGKDSTIDYEKMTVSDFVSRIEFKEPFVIRSPSKKYEFRWKRIKDLLRAKAIADREYDSKIKHVKRQRWDNKGSLAEFKAMQEAKVKELNQKKGKAIILYSMALSLMKVNGVELDEMERIREYEQIDPNTLKTYVDYLDAVKFGIQDERDYTCNLCGKPAGRDHRQFQSITSLVSLILDSDTSLDGQENIDGSYIYFGI